MTTRTRWRLRFLCLFLFAAVIAFWSLALLGPQHGGDERAFRIGALIANVLALLTLVVSFPTARERAERAARRR